MREGRARPACFSWHMGFSAHHITVHNLLTQICYHWKHKENYMVHSESWLFDVAVVFFVTVQPDLVDRLEKYHITGSSNCIVTVPGPHGCFHLSFINSCYTCGLKALSRSHFPKKRRHCVPFSVTCANTRLRLSEINAFQWGLGGMGLPLIP